MNIWRNRKQSRSPEDPPGIIFSRRSQVFEGVNPNYGASEVTARSSPEILPNRRLTISDLAGLTRSLVWLTPIGWEDPCYSTPFPAYVLAKESASRLAKRGVVVDWVPWPDEGLTTSDYCSSVYTEELEAIRDPANRMKMYLATVDTPITISWGGADDPTLSYRIEGQDFYQAVAGVQSLCKTAIFEFILSSLDFTTPVEGILAARGSGGENPWAEDTTARFSPFYRLAKAPSLGGSLGLLSYVVD